MSGSNSIGSNNNNFYLIFIHDLQSWTKKRLMEFFIQEIPNCNTFIQSIVKKYSPTLGIYFILRVDGSNPLSTLSFILLICNKLPISKEIKWIKCNSTRSNRSNKKFTLKNPFKNSLPSDFFSTTLILSLHALISVLAGILMVEIMKKRMAFYISFLLLNLYVYAFRKSETVNFCVIPKTLHPISQTIILFTDVIIQMSRE